MKKVFILLVAAACVAVSCKQEIKGEVLSPEQNKETLDETCTKAVELLEVENWQSTADLITASVEVFNSIEGTDDGWEEFAENNLTFETTIRDEEPYEYLIDLSKANGKITIKDNILYGEAGTGLSIAYTLADGTAVDGKLTVKNSKTTALVDTDYSSNWDADGNWYQTVWSKTYLVIPASVEGVLNAGGKKTAGVKITTDVNMAGTEPKPTDTFAATCEVTADKYTFAVTRAKYSQTEVALNACIKYDKQTVVAATFEAKGKIATDEDGEEIDPFASTGNVNATFSIMDNVQLKGTLNWTEVAKLAENQIKTEEDAKALATAAEKYINLTLYIQNTAQAKLGFEAIYDEEHTEWDVEPVIRFEDGSAYVMPEAFFTDANFPKTVAAIEKALGEMESFLSGPEEEVEPLK